MSTPVLAGGLAGGGVPAVLFNPFQPRPYQRLLRSRLITPVANAADTNFVIIPIMTIPAGLLQADGDLLIAQVRYTLSAAASSKTYQLNLGYTAAGVGGFTGGTNIYSNATATASTDIDLFAYMLRLSATQMAFWSSNQLVPNGAAQGTQYTTAARTWANAADLALSIRDGTGNAAAITMQFAQLTLSPNIT